MGLLVLGGENVVLADGEAVGADRALLEGGFETPCGRDGVVVDADVLGHGSVGSNGGAADGGHELLGEHRCGVACVFDCLLGEV